MSKFEALETARRHWGCRAVVKVMAGRCAIGVMISSFVFQCYGLARSWDKAMKMAVSIAPPRKAA